MTEYGIRIYKLRWFITVALTLMQSIAVVNVSTGILNDVYVKYFRITYVQVDFMYSGPFIGSVPVTALLAFLFIKRKVQLRKLTLIAASCLTSSLMLVGGATLDRSLFSLALIGQVLDGITRAIGKTLPATFAVLWFPDNQVGTAMGIVSLGISLGDISSTLLMGGIVKSRIQEGEAVLRTQTSRNVHIDNTMTFQNMSSNEYSTLETMMSIRVVNFACAAMVFLVLVFFIAFVTDAPPKPPTHAQASKRRNKADIIKPFIPEVKKLFKDTTYVLLALSWTLYLQTIGIQLAFLGQIVRNMDVGGDPYEVTSYILVAYFVGCVSGSLVTGRMIDLYKNNSLIMKVGSLCTLVASTGVVIGMSTGCVWFMIVSNLLFGFFNRTAFVPIMEKITQQTYPTDEGFVNLWVSVIDGIFGMAITAVGRLVFITSGSFAVLSLQIVAMLIGAVIVWTTNIELRRAQVEKDEETRLLQDD